MFKSQISFIYEYITASLPQFLAFGQAMEQMAPVLNGKKYKVSEKPETYMKKG